VMGMQGNEQQPEMPATMGASQAASSEPSWGFVLLWAAGLIIGGGFIWNRMRPNNAPTKATAWRISTNPTVSKAGSLEFCTQCGATLKSGAHFCHICGTPCQVAPEQQNRQKTGEIG